MSSPDWVKWFSPNVLQNCARMITLCRSTITPANRHTCLFHVFWRRQQWNTGYPDKRENWVGGHPPEEETIAILEKKNKNKERLKISHPLFDVSLIFFWCHHWCQWRQLLQVLAIFPFEVQHEEKVHWFSADFGYCKLLRDLFGNTQYTINVTWVCNWSLLAQHNRPAHNCWMLNVPKQWKAKYPTREYNLVWAGGIWKIGLSLFWQIVACTQTFDKGVHRNS